MNFSSSYCMHSVEGKLLFTRYKVESNLVINYVNTKACLSVSYCVDKYSFACFNVENFLCRLTTAFYRRPYLLTQSWKVDDLSFNCDYFAVPGDPQGVIAKVINSTAINVQWQPPQEKDRHGVIRGYHVHVQEAKEEVKFFNYNKLE
jgi:Fibronectin type III domain